MVKNVVFALISEYNVKMVKTGYSFGTDIITEAPVMISGRGLNLSLFGDRVETWNSDFCTFTFRVCEVKYHIWPLTFPQLPHQGAFYPKETPESTALWSSAFQFQLSLNPNGRRLKWKDWIKASAFFLFLFGERRLWPTCNYFSSLWLPSRLISLHPFSPSPSPPPSLSPSTARPVSQSVLFPVSWQRIGLSENPLMQD